MCALKKIVQVLELSAPSGNNKNKDWRDFRVVMRTAPGGRVFEGTMRLNNQSVHKFMSSEIIKESLSTATA